VEFADRGDDSRIEWGAAIGELHFDGVIGPPHLDSNGVLHSPAPSVLHRVREQFFERKVQFHPEVIA